MSPLATRAKTTLVGKLILHVMDMSKTKKTLEFKETTFAEEKLDSTVLKVQGKQPGQASPNSWKLRASAMGTVRRSDSLPVSIHIL